MLRRQRPGLRRGVRAAPAVVEEGAAERRGWAVVRRGAGRRQEGHGVHRQVPRRRQLPRGTRRGYLGSVDLLLLPPVISGSGYVPQAPRGGWPVRLVNRPLICYPAALFL